MNTNKKHHFKSGTVQLLYPDVLLVIFNKSSVIRSSDTEKIRDIRKGLIGEKNFYNIIDMSLGLVRTSKGAKAWMAVNQKSAERRIIDIIVAPSGLTKTKAVFYLLLYKPEVETKVVSNLEQALEFIQNHKKNAKT